jgi:hypothetical protein
MFAARQQFNFQAPASAAWGNNALFPANAAQYISKPGTTNLVTWKATTGYTIEYWGYWSAFGNTINGGPGNSDGAGTNYWTFGPITSGQLEFYYWGSGQQYFSTATGAVPLNAWTNVAAVFTTSGSTVTASLYVNGIRQQIQWNKTGTYADTKTATNGIVSAGTVFGMGKYGAGLIGGNQPFYLNNLRVSNINRYSGASYTLATEAFTSDANTQLLIQPTGSSGTTIPYTGAVSGNMTNASNLVSITTTRANHT